MSKPDLKADCANCVALCCVAPDFERSDRFAFTKPAGVACRHLGRDFRCTIHERLESAGFGGCVEYDCFGAGQKTTRRFAARSDWREDAAIKARMLDVYHVLRPLHELMVYLTELAGINDDGAIGAEIEAATAEIERLTEGDEAALRAIDVAAHKDAVERLIGRVRDAL